MWIIQESKKVALWNKRHFEEKNEECAACLKHWVLIFVEKIYKMQHLEGSGTPVLYIRRTILKGWYKKTVLPSVPLTVRPYGTTLLSLHEFSRNFMFECFFENLFGKLKFFKKYDRNNGRFTRMPLYVYDISLRSLQNENIFRQEFQRKSEYISTFNKCFQKSCRLLGNVKKYGRPRQAADDNMAHELYICCITNATYTYS